MPNKSEIINENKEKGMVERESSWTVEIKDLDLFLVEEQKEMEIQ